MIFNLHHFRHILIAALCLVGSHVAAQNCEVPIDRQIIDSIFDRQFDLASSLIESEEETQIEKLFYRGVLMLADQPFDKPLDVDVDVIEYLEGAISGSNTPVFTQKMSDEYSLAITHMLLAKLHYENDAWSNALRHAQTGQALLLSLMQINPTFESLYYPLGAFEYALENTPVSLQKLSRLKSHIGEKGQSREWIERAITQDPITAPEAARTLLTEVDTDLYTSCGYIQLAEQLTTRYPNNPQWTLILQKYLLRCGQPEKALLENMSAEKRFQNESVVNISLQSLRLNAYSDMGKPKEIKGLDLDPELEQYRFLSLGRALDQQGLFMAAEVAYRKYIDYAELSVAQRNYIEKLIQYHYRPPRRIVREPILFLNESCLAEQ